MTGDEAVRKEFEAWFRSKYYAVDPIAEATVWAAWQASRSAAIQECVNLIRVVDPQFVLTDALSALDAPLALKER